LKLWYNKQNLFAKELNYLIPEIILKKEKINRGMDGTMGGACSTQRNTDRHNRSSSRNDRNRCLPSDGSRSSRSKSPKRLCSRHSVVSAVPDDFISNLYPLADNYVLEDNGLRSPKTLADLCTDTICRSLPYLDGALPPGLPQDVVDDVTASLVKHSALNATTLRVLRNCEMGSLTLSGSRGVTDAWLEPLSCSVTCPTNGSTSPLLLSSPFLDQMISDTNDDDDRKNDRDDTTTTIEAMDLDGYEDPSNNNNNNNPSIMYDVEALEHSPEVFYNAKLRENEASSYDSNSTSSFVSASSKHHRHDEKNSGMSFNMGHGCKSNCTDNNTKLPSILFPQLEMINNHRGIGITSHITLLDLRGSQRLTDKGLLQLSDLSSLEIAKLDNCHSIQGRGLVALSRSHHLHTLSLANCRRLSDEAIINISHLISLEALSLDGCRCLTDRSLAAIGNLIRIKKLDLSQCDLMTDTGLQELENSENIEELSLGWCRSITDNGVGLFANQRGRPEKMRILSLARIPITDTGIKHLSSLSSLEELDLKGCSNIGSSSLGNTLAKLTLLERLDVSYCPGILRSSWQGKINSLKALDACYSAVKDSHISRLTDLSALEELNLDSCPIGDWTISHLESVVPNLVSLDLADTDLSDLGMVHLAKFKKLKRLSLFYCNLTNSSLQHLSSLSKLEVLNLDSREIDDNGLWHLQSLQLKSLDIFSGRVTDQGCSHIAKIKSLENLECCGGGVTDAGCSKLATLENLVSLNLSQNERITNRGAAALAALSKLKALNLSNTRVNSEALIHFSDLMNLKSLALYGCQGMKETKNDMLDRLQSGLPNLKCVRLNNGSDYDGIITARGEDTDDEDMDSDTGQVVFGSNSNYQRLGEGELHDAESQSDSDSEMVDAHAVFDSDDDEEEYDSDSSLSHEL